MSVRILPARAFPYLVAVTLASTAFLPHGLNPSVVTLVGTLLGGLGCVAAAALSRRAFSRGTTVTVLLLAATASWFALASSWAASPAVAIYGMVGQHNGAALWILVTTWALAGLLCADARSLRETLAVVSAAGVVFAGAALYETIASGSQRGQGYAAGFFENSTSAGEMLGIALLAAITGAVISGRKPGRIVYIAAAVICAGGLLQSSSRTGWLGTGAAFAFAALVYFVPKRRSRPWVLGLAAAAAAVTFTALALAASTGTLGAAMQQTVSALGTQRDVIWRAALAQFAQAPVFGQGLDQFSTLIGWSLASGQLTFQATTDPHNILLAAALGGGIIGVLLLLASFTALLGQGAAIARSATRNPGIAMTASVPAFILGAGLVGWISPAAALSAAAITGAMLGAAHAKTIDSRARGADYAGFARARVVRAAALAVGVGALVVALTSIGPFSVARVYVATQSAGESPLSASQVAELYSSYPDPRIPADVLSALTGAVQSRSIGAADQAARLLAQSEKGTTWSSLLAVRQLVTAQALEAKDPTEFARFERIVAAAADGDPTTGAWYAFAALEAGRLGLKDRSVEYAQKALMQPMAPADRALLERVAAQ